MRTYSGSASSVGSRLRRCRISSRRSKRSALSLIKSIELESPGVLLQLGSVFLSFTPFLLLLRTCATVPICRAVRAIQGRRESCAPLLGDLPTQMAPRMDRTTTDHRGVSDPPELVDGPSSSRQRGVAHATTASTVAIDAPDRAAQNAAQRDA